MDQTANRAAAILVWLAPLLFLWQGLIRQLSGEWLVNPQYAFGWAVPAMGLYLLYRKLRGAGLPSNPQVHYSGKRVLMFEAVLAACYGPTRLIQEANPEWRLVSWALALITVGITTCVLSTFLQPFAKLGPNSSILFPVFFFLVSVPWPTPLERPTVSLLTTLVLSGATELLGILGIPSVLHGNILEVGPATVSVVEACSGIRSFQASLMLALFFGEKYELVPQLRLMLIFIGVGFSVVLNIVRATFLAFIAAKSGLNAMNSCHGPASTMIPAFCFAGIWVFGFWLRDRSCDSIPNMGGALSWRYVAQCCAIRANQVVFPIALAVWFAAVELGTETWYRVHEQKLPAPSIWHIELPRDKPGFRKMPIAPISRQFLRFDEGLNATWTTDEALQCQVTFLRWNPGRVAARLARNHTPADCLVAAGYELAPESVLHVVHVRGLDMPFQSFMARSEFGFVHVFYCLWNDRAPSRTFEAEKLNYSSRMAAVIAGERNSGQRSLELVFWGAENEATAQNVLREVLEQIVVAD